MMEQTPTALDLGEVPAELVQAFVEAMKLVLQAGRGRVEVEVTASKYFVRPTPSWSIERNDALNP